MTQERSTPTMEKNGSIAIIGSGIAGIQTALDIANSGFKVHLVEEKPNVGGVMAQLDKTFPTNDCSSCMLGPKLAELANHPNIDIFAYTDVLRLGGEPGRFQLTLKRKARAVDPEKCVACDLCAEKCPQKVSDPFNLYLNQRKAIYIPYPQAVPLVYTIDKEHFISGIDFFPTVCEAISLPIPAGLDGVSFLPLLKGKRQSGRGGRDRLSSEPPSSAPARG